MEEGGANVWVRDRWGKTAYDEARRVGATAVAELLAMEMERRPELSRTVTSGTGPVRVRRQVFE